MKKLMTMIAAVGMAFGLFAEEPATGGAYAKTSIEAGETDPFPTGWVKTADDDSAAATFEETRVENSSEAYTAKSVRYGGFVAGNLSFLQVKNSLTGTPLYYNIGDEAQAIEDNVCFDTLIQFTEGCDDDPAVNSDAKIAVWLKTTDAADLEPGVEAETNLYITAGIVENNEIVQHNFLVADSGIEPGSWHRVTIRTIANVLSDTPALPGFLVYIDGNIVSGGDSFQDLSLNGTADRFAAKGQLFVSAAGEGATTIQSIGFAGRGYADDISVTWGDQVPTFAFPATDATIAAEEGLLKFQYRINEGDYITVTVGDDDYLFQVMDGDIVYFKEDGFEFAQSEEKAYTKGTITANGFQYDEEAGGYKFSGADTPSLTIGVTATPYVVTVVDGEGEFHGYTTAAAAIAAIDTVGFAGSIAILNEDGFNYRGVKGAIGFNQEDTITVDDQGVWFVTNADEIAVSSVAAGADIRVKDDVSVSGVIAGKLTIVEGGCLVSADLEIDNEDWVSAGDEGMLFALGGFSLEDEVLITLGEHGLLQTVNKQTYQGDGSIFEEPEEGKKIKETEVGPEDEVVGYQYTLVALGNFQVTVPDLTTGLEFVAMTNGEDEVTEPAAGNYTVKEGDTFTVVYAPATGYEFTDDLEDGVRTAKSAAESPIVPPTVKAILVTDVTLDITSTNVVAGETFTLTATVTPDTALDKTIAWTTSDEGVATVANGAVTAVAAGTATITATNAASGVFAICTVTVSAKTPTFGGGDGSAGNPFKMATADHFTELQEFVAAGETFADTFFTLTGDIDMDSKVWTGIGNGGSGKGTLFFSGTLDGAGFAIKNIKFDNTKTYGGFFATLNGATIKNITFNVVDYDTEGAADEYGAGVVAGWVIGSTFDGVTVTGEINATHTVAGFTVKAANSTFVDCTNNAAIHSTAKCAAGFVGFDSSIYITGTPYTGYPLTFTRCVNNGAITLDVVTDSNDYGVGGFIAGLCEGDVTFTDCASVGLVKSDKITRTGSFIGAVNRGTSSGSNFNDPSLVSVTGCTASNVNQRAIGLVMDAAKTFDSSALAFATIAGDPEVATFEALAAGKTFKVMVPGAAPEFEFAAEGTIAFNTNLCEVASFAGITGDESLNVTDDEEGGIVTFTAALKTFTVTFKPENGQSDIVSNDVVYGTAFADVKPDNPTKEHFTFQGWDPVVEKIDGTKLTFTAQWLEDAKFDVTFTTNNVPMADKTKNVYTGTTLTEDDVPELTGGDWDVNPVGAVITCATNFNYTIAAPAPTPDPYDPGAEIPSSKSATEINEMGEPAATEFKKTLFTPPVGSGADDTYYTYFKAVDGDTSNTVKFELNEAGKQEVADAEKAADTATLEAALDSEKTAVTVGTPLKGFYYSFKQNAAVTALEYTGKNKLGGKDEITFELQKPETSGFYQMIVTPSPVD